MQIKKLYAVPSAQDVRLYEGFKFLKGIYRSILLQVKLNTLIHLECRPKIRTWNIKCETITEGY